jgi:hypothetical protein
MTTQQWPDPDFTTPQQAPGLILSDAEIIAKFEAAISEDPAAYSRPGECVYQITRDEVLAYSRALAAVPGKGEPVAYRVAEFWSSANPKNKVRMLAEGDDIEQWAKRSDFIRWVDAATVGEVVAAPTEPKLVLALPDYETRRIVISSDEVIDGERLVCVAIEGDAVDGVVARPDLAKLNRYEGEDEFFYLADDIERLFAALPPQATSTSTGDAPRRPLVGCAAGRDGDCTHPDCPQLQDHEPKATGRHCPLDTSSEED